LRPIEDTSVPFQLADGTDVILRPVACGDREYFRTGFRSMSPQSRYRRFFSYSPGLSDAQLRYFNEVDQINHVAWVAVADRPTRAAGLGVARFIRMPEQPDVAEFSVAVIDAMQRKGLGRALLAMLHLLADNQNVVSWLCRLGAESRGYFGEETIELDLRVHKSAVVFAPSGSTAERFASALNYFRRALAEAGAKLHSPSNAGNKYPGTEASAEHSGRVRQGSTP